MFLGNQASNLGNWPSLYQAWTAECHEIVTGVFEASHESLKQFQFLKDIFTQFLRLFIARLNYIKIKMPMTGGPSELKVADEEVQKICDEVICSTFV